jgi:DNA polymerase (family 10)
MPNSKPTNEEIARVLDRIADLLETQEANPHRVRAYRNGASTVRGAQEPVSDLALEGGRQALQELPGIGKGLSGVIGTFVKRGRSDLLARLEGEVGPENLFLQVPGIGEELAHRIASQLDVQTLEELEQAAHDGRVEQVEGIGPKRAESIRVGLAGLLSGAARRRLVRGSQGEAERRAPGVEVLLDVDAEYRRRAEAGELRTIAPKRFNPKGEAWLPVLHTERGEWNFTALYSNTARAHELGKTHDWVVIYYDHDGTEDQATVVTQGSGPLEGRRIVRGREPECRRYYAAGDGRQD